MVNGPIKAGKGGRGKRYPNNFFIGPRHSVFIDKFQAANAGKIQMIPGHVKKYSPNVISYAFEVVKNGTVYIPKMSESVATLFNAPSDNLLSSNKTQLQATKRLGCVSGPIECNSSVFGTGNPPCGLCCSSPGSYTCFGYGVGGESCNCIDGLVIQYRNAMVKSKPTDEFIPYSGGKGKKMLLIVNMVSN